MDEIGLETSLVKLIRLGDSIISTTMSKTGFDNVLEEYMVFRGGKGYSPVSFRDYCVKHGLDVHFIVLPEY